MTRSFRAWRLAANKVKLAGAEMALANELEVERKTGSVFPVVLNQLSREIGELREKVRQLSEDCDGA